MALKSIVSNAVKIAYFEKNESAAFTLFFFHGNSSSHHSWKHIFDQKIFEHCRIVAFDLPGHGDSDSSPDCSLLAIGKLLAECINQMADSKPFILVGVSLGTNIIAEALSYDIDPLGIVLAGPCIVGTGCAIPDIMIPNTCVGLSFTDELDNEQLNELARLLTNKHLQSSIDQLENDFKLVKSNFRSKFGLSVSEGKFSDQVQIINNKNLPTLVIIGDADRVFFSNYLDHISLPLWNNKIYKISGGHWIHLDNPHLFNELLSNFVQDIFF